MSEPRSDRPLALVSVLQTLGALLAIALGYIYDSEKMTPGILTLAGVGILAGPAFWVAARRGLAAMAKGGE